MSRRASVVFFLVIAFAATAAFGQTAPTITYVTLENGNIQVQYSGGSGPGGKPPAQYQVRASFTSTTDNTVRVIDRTAATTALTYLASEIPRNTPVQITVVAVDSTGGQSPASSPYSTVSAPAAPTGVKGLGGRNKISISWDPAPGAASYRVSLSNGMSFTTTSTTHVVTGLPNATSFNCIVWSYNAAGAQSAGSAPVAVRTANIALIE